MTLKIGFHSNAMSLRGTEIALYDYALYNQTLLGNESVIFYNPNVPINDPAVIEKFKLSFELIPYSDFSEVSRLALNNHLDALYLIKSGEKDGRFISEVPSLVHAVFPQPPKQRHGHTYAFVSEWLSKEYSNFRIPYVPHIATLPNLDSNLRSNLNIPADALVLGCHGGHDSFNIGFAKEIVLKTLKLRSDLYFIFLNISQFGNHERLLFLKGNADLEYKTKFINTCDAMLHARKIGESFGLGCAEFSLRNKPVISYYLSPQRSHLEILESKLIPYTNAKDLQNIILNLSVGEIKSQNWDCYSKKFSPETIMKKFQAVFLNSLGRPEKSNEKFTINDYVQILKFRARRRFFSTLKKYYNLIH